MRKCLFIYIIYMEIYVSGSISLTWNARHWKVNENTCFQWVKMFSPSLYNFLLRLSLFWQMGALQPQLCCRNTLGTKKNTGNHPVPGSQPWKQSSVFQKTSLFFLTMWRISRFTFPWLDSGEGSINSWQVSLCGFYMNVVFPVHVTVPGAGTEQKNSLLPWRARLSKATQ